MITKKSLEAIAKKYNLLLIVLFGSRAGDNVRRESDVDIAIWEEDGEIDELRLFYDFIDLYTPQVVDLLILNKADPLSQFEVALKGRVLYEADEGEFMHFQLYAMKRNDDRKKFHDLSNIYLDRFLKGDYVNEGHRCYPPKIRKDGGVSFKARTHY